MKKCSKCKIEKELGEFNKRPDSRDGLNAACRGCTKQRYKDWYTKNSEKTRLRVSTWQKANPQKMREMDLNAKYKITLEQYDQMHAEQNGCCAICNTHESKLKTLVVDHNHSTGQVRGLLCHYCNTSIGFLRDRPHLARAAAKYLIHTDQSRALRQASIEAFLKTHS